jgi:hypothetical protein
MLDAMRLAAVVGENNAIDVLATLAGAPDVELVSIWCATDQLESLVREILPHARLVGHWSELLTGRRSQGVLVSGTSAEVLSAGRQFVQAGLPLLILTDTVAGPARIFDWTALWHEQPEMVFPLFVSGIQSAAREAALQLQECGEIRKIEILRQHEVPHATEPGLSPALVDRLFLQDLAWIRGLAGRSSQVTMLSLGRDPECPEEVVVALRGTETPEVRWSVRAAPTADWSVSIVAARGTAALACERDHLPVLNVDGLARPLNFEDARRQDLQDQLQTFISPGRLQSMKSWEDFLEMGETGAAARRSLLRRRTVDIHYAKNSERSEFKSQMTALGCGALVWAMLGAVALLMLMGIFDPRDREYRISASAGFVLPESDFISGQQLSSRGLEQIRHISKKWSSTSPVVILESAEAPPLDQDRQRLVETELELLGVRDPERRIVVRPLPGKWFEILALCGWGIVFGPIGIALLLQLFIFVSQTKPIRQEE